MPKITYVEFDGASHVVEVPVGQSVMQGAIRNDVPGIEADCGGACSCATCHCYVDAQWLPLTGGPGEIEAAMLDLADNVHPDSRLACQIKVSEALDGLVVRMPKSQR